MLRAAEEHDLDVMRSWRNQSANREVSIHSHLISPEEHSAWWARVEADPSRQVLVFEHDGRPLGVVNFFDLDLDSDSPSGSWGFYLDHETVSGEGIAMMAWMKVMQDATDHAFAAPPEGLGLAELCGEVLEGNEAVRTMNRRFRFREGPPEKRTVEGREITVYPISLRSTDRRRRAAGRS